MSLLSYFRKDKPKQTEIEEIFESICDILNTKRTFGYYQRDLGLDTYIYLSTHEDLSQKIVQDIKECLAKYERRVVVQEVLHIPSDNCFSLSFVIKCKIKNNNHSFQLSFQHQKKSFSPEAIS